jgi:hypothetical protein
MSPEAKRIHDAHKNGSYVHEADSALRGLRDAEGILRAQHTAGSTVVGRVTVGRQWYEQMLKDIITLQGEQEVMLGKLKEAEVALKKSAVTLDGACADLKFMIDLRNRVPGWVRWIFGA